jgi:putative transcriptional regulator
MTKKYKTDALASLHSMMSDLLQAGGINQETMRHFDAGCLTPIKPLKPKQIKALRESAEVSQPVFAIYLGVSKETVSQWERGLKRPSGAALKLLSLVSAKGLDAIA